MAKIFHYGLGWFTTETTKQSLLCGDNEILNMSALYEILLSDNETW